MSESSVGLRAWKGRMLVAGLLLLVAGAVAMVGGGLYAGKQQYQGADGDVMAGIWTGTFGTLAVITGVVLAKLGLVGPYPKQFAHEGPEVDD